MTVNRKSWMLFPLLSLSCTRTVSPPEYEPQECSYDFPYTEEDTGAIDSTTEAIQNSKTCVIGENFTISENEVLDGWERSPAQILDLINEYHICNWEEKEGFIQPYFTLENPEIKVFGQSDNNSSICEFRILLFLKISFYDENGDCVMSSGNYLNTDLYKDNIHTWNLSCEQIVAYPTFTKPIEYGCFGSFSGYFDESQEQIDDAWFSLGERYTEFSRSWTATCTRE